MHYDYLFVGGGLSSSLCVLALLHRKPSASIAVVERGPRLGGNHTWCFHARDVRGCDRVWVEPLIVQRWAGYHVRFPGRVRRLSSPYGCVTSDRLRDVVTATLEGPRCRIWVGAEVDSIREDRVTLQDGSEIFARVIVDARGPAANCPPESTGFQKFVGLEIVGEAPTSFPREPIIMDACLPQQDGFRFMYVLPFSERRWLLEETFFSDRPELDERGCQQRILDYAREKGFRDVRVVRTERGVLPMPWKFAAPRVAPGHLLAGYRGGFFHPVTGYSFPIAVRYASALADNANEVEPAALSSRARARGRDSALTRLTIRHQQQQRFLFFLTRMMFGIFEPAQRFEVLEHFYRLPEPIIERFYAADLRPLDWARLFMGAPPRGLSLRRALRTEGRALVERFS